jgi:hypothetical protein
MSDFSTLFKKYNSVSNLTNDLNNSVITLKRRNLVSKPEIKQKHPQLEVSDDDVLKAKKDIINILSALESFYRNQDTNNELYELMDNSLFKKQILNDAEFKTQIIEALEKVKNSKELNSRDLSNIDKFISVLDNESAVLFRKLRTNRG